MNQRWRLLVQLSAAVAAMDGTNAARLSAQPRYVVFISADREPIDCRASAVCAMRRATRSTLCLSLERPMSVRGVPQCARPHSQAACALRILVARRLASRCRIAAACRSRSAPICASKLSASFMCLRQRSNDQSQMEEPMKQGQAGEDLNTHRAMICCF